ncbi:hypothetical protein CNEO_40037 [Clostridium neonatale]|uniref:Uncharacterized protein n=1 Tax=Clostridium neonatale TaxID=137838 RepID=A0AA86MQF7_9CLOT|nr:hypothetical protein CNEO_40037 [Clostridium neonatale]
MLKLHFELIFKLKIKFGLKGVRTSEKASIGKNDFNGNNNLLDF